MRALRRDGGGWLVRTERAGDLRAPAVVVAAGVATRALIEPLGVKLPMEGAKGYSLTFEKPSRLPRGSIYILDSKLAIAPYVEALRIAGTLELGARRRDLPAARLKAVEQAAGRALRDWAPHGPRQAWAGFRPLTTDGLPVLGSVPGHPGLSVATGHSMLGITLAPTSGELLAPVVLEGAPSLELAPFTIARFGNRAAPTVKPASAAE